MTFLYNKLRGKIVEVFGSQAIFSRAIHLSEQSITAKLTGKSSFSQSDIITWCDALGIDQNDIGLYFFTR